MIELTKREQDVIRFALHEFARAQATVGNGKRVRNEARKLYTKLWQQAYPEQASIIKAHNARAKAIKANSI